MGNLHSHENAKCCKWKCGSFMGSRAKHFTNAHTGDCGVARFIWVEGCPCVPSWSTLHEKSPTLSSARTRKGHCPKFLCHFNAESSAAFLTILLVWLVLWHPDSHLKPVFGVCGAGATRLLGPYGFGERTHQCTGWRESSSLFPGIKLFWSWEGPAAFSK